MSSSGNKEERSALILAAVSSEEKPSVLGSREKREKREKSAAKRVGSSSNGIPDKTEKSQQSLPMDQT